MQTVVDVSFIPFPFNYSSSIYLKGFLQLVKVLSKFVVDVYGQIVSAWKLYNLRLWPHGN